MPDGETLLVNFWYAHPLGHVVEALRYSLGYHRADPSLRVSVALNRASGVELTALCPWIGRTYATDYTSFLEPGDDVTSALSVVPRQWDWIVDDARGHDEAQLAAFAGLRGYYAAAAAYFEARCARGLAGARPPAYLPHQQVVLGLPDEARACARRELGQGQPRIALMPAGSGMRSAYPSSRYWRLVLHELRVRYPDVVVCLIGKLRRNERTSTSMTPDEVAELASVSPRVVDAFDRPLAEQLALAEACDLFLSPHTGFGMAVLAVGTPWLTLAGGPWPEFFFNGVPFCSVLPDPERYPCYEGLEAPVVWSDDEGEGPRVPSMSGRRIIDDLPRLLGAAERLLQQSLPYETALREHFDRLLAFHGGDRTRIWSIDGIHEQYV